MMQMIDYRNALLMPLPDDRNILKFGPPKYPGQAEITPAMVESVRQRIKEAGGILTVWAVLNEDVYETHPAFALHRADDKIMQNAIGLDAGGKPFDGFAVHLPARVRGGSFQYGQ